MYDDQNQRSCCQRSKRFREEIKEEFEVSLAVKDNYERENRMHMDNELAAKRRRILLVNF